VSAAEIDGASCLAKPRGGGFKLVAVTIAPTGFSGAVHEILRHAEVRNARLTAGRLNASILLSAPDEPVAILDLAFVQKVATPMEAQLPLADIAGSDFSQDVDARHGTFQ
jgi:hypothetical protein